jgi:hypothetical protein
MNASAASAVISGRAPQLAHMLALHPEHHSLHTSLQLADTIRAQDEEEGADTEELEEKKRTASANMFHSIVGSIKPKKQFHLRVVYKGQVLGILSLLKVYNRHLETVKAIGQLECYTISTDAFYDVLSKHAGLIERLQDRVTSTHFKMAPHPEATTKYGVPLYRYRREDIKSKEEAYLHKMLTKERELADQVRKEVGIVLNSKDSQGSIHEEWTVCDISQ